MCCLVTRDVLLILSQSDLLLCDERKELSLFSFLHPSFFPLPPPPLLFLFVGVGLVINLIFHRVITGRLMAATSYFFVRVNFFFFFFLSPLIVFFLSLSKLFPFHFYYCCRLINFSKTEGRESFDLFFEIYRWYIYMCTRIKFIIQHASGIDFNIGLIKLRYNNRYGSNAPDSIPGSELELNSFECIMQIVINWYLLVVCGHCAVYASGNIYYCNLWNQNWNRNRIQIFKKFTVFSPFFFQIKNILL